MEKRKFSVHPQIIYSLITSQAGTLAKGLLECVMNSIDAGATKVDIKVSREGLSVVDDGQGFRTRDEIEQYFEVFGFPHEEGGRIYGQFGIGRAQLWSFARTVWRTNTFEMDVDIKERGLDYGLRENLSPVQGVSIVGTFYKKLLTSDVLACEREFAELAVYAQIPVTLNGKLLSSDPSKEKWDHDTPDAWIRLKEHGDLQVYNLGVLVRRYPAYYLGSAGVVVTKPGVRLALNMARNDILVSECAVWQRIRPFVQAKSDARVRTKQVRLSEAELANRTLRFLSGELSYEQVADDKLVTDIQNRGYTLARFASAIGEWKNRPVTVANKGSRVGEKAHTSKLAFVLNPITLARFGVETPTELRTLLARRMHKEEQPWFSGFDKRPFFDELSQAAPGLSERCVPLQDSEVTREEKAVLFALQAAGNVAGPYLAGHGYVSPKTARRRLRIGVSDAAAAWTDGQSNIFFERKTLRLARQGIGGFITLLNVMVHEYLHDATSVDTHEHDLEFYQRYHDATSAPTHSFLGDTAAKYYRFFVTYCEQHGIRLLRSQVHTADTLDRIENLSESPDAGPSALLATA